MRDRAVRLFAFLREMTLLRTKVIQSFDQYDNVIWLADIPREPGCHCAAWGTGATPEDNTTWIEVRKPQLAPPPDPPVGLAPWIDTAQLVDSSREFPELRDSLTAANELDPDGPPTLEKLADHADIKPMWEHYVEDAWWPWAELDRRAQRVQRAYTDLFSIYQKQHRLAELYEVVLALGLLTWKTGEEREIKRHIVTAQANLEFDAKRGVLTVGVGAEGAKLRLEQDMLDPQDQPDPAHQNGFSQELAEAGDDVWQGGRVKAVVQGWITALRATARFEDTLDRPHTADSIPRMHFAPALIMRRRTDRSLIQVFDAIKKDLENGGPLPKGVQRLVTIVEDQCQGPGEAGNATPEGTAEQEIYFPLPANEEQLRIVRRLSQRTGVLVQGPPGTGKSHTIANLICHLLATGNRVLVTSQTPRALKVLQGKIPKTVSPLCVSLLGDDRDAMASLDDSVRGIIDRHVSWDHEHSFRTAQKLATELDSARKQEAETLSHLRAKREQETYVHHLPGGYDGTAEKIARALRAEDTRFDWFHDIIEGDEAPPLSDADATELLVMLRSAGDEQEREAGKSLVTCESLIAPAGFAELVKRESLARSIYENSAPLRRHAAYLALKAAGRVQREQLCQSIRELGAEKSALEKQPDQWVQRAVQDVLGARHHIWLDLVALTRENLDEVERLLRDVETLSITGIEGRDLAHVKASAAELLKHLEQGGGLGVSIFRPKAVKQGLFLIEEAQINGRPAGSREGLRQLLAWLGVMERLKHVDAHWAEHGDVPAGPLRSRCARYRSAASVLEKILALEALITDARTIAVTISGLPEPAWNDAESLRALDAAARAADVEEDLAEVGTPFNELEKLLEIQRLQPESHQVNTAILDSIRQRDTDRYAELHGAVQQLWETRARLARRHSLLTRLQARSPRLAAELVSNFSDAVWDGRLRALAAAWNWASTQRWLNQFSDSGLEMNLVANLEVHRDSVGTALGAVAAEFAWQHCFARLTEEQREHLVSWKKAVDRIGKGTGKYAEVHRRSAREHMEYCRPAIPAWIMPIYRVAENIGAVPEAFDVVIVDEASQSGPEALFLQYIARKIVVVGDDKQISPEAVGFDREDVAVLRQRFISDLPHKDAIGVDNSFFDLAEIYYQERIPLREHFRCVPEIIQFSNNMWYSAQPLIPLRQYGADRLDPVKTTHVATGYQQGTTYVVNPPEAEAIANRVVACCHDPAYDGKTMGVISLLGPHQARHIEQILLRRLGPEEMEKRNLVCGDAYALQGDQRHVVFLSLVSAPGGDRRIGSLTAQNHQRRFNVAASRAEDQLWLFHTATLNDLHPDCLRYRLLDYCLRPAVSPGPVGEIAFGELQKLAATADRFQRRQPPQFDSWFEVDVYLQIAVRRYRVLPQFEIAGRRIDLLVEGMRGRLAVECDGDLWHGAEQYASDMARQRQLERAGLRFWRIRGSVFYRNPEKALEPLWSELTHLGIHAHNISASNPISEPTTRDDRSAMGGASTLREVPGGDRGLMDEYRSWKPRVLPNPLTGDDVEVMDGLVEIITAEGPMTRRRAFKIYARASGSRLRDTVVPVLNRALVRAIHKHVLDQRNETGGRDPLDYIVRKADTQPVWVRARGDRTLEEIPPSEVAAVADSVRLRQPACDDEQMLRLLRDLYGLGRLTETIRDVLLPAIRQRLDFGPKLYRV